MARPRGQGGSVKITQVSFGNYETATVELVAEVQEGEDAIECIDALVLKAHQWHNRKEAKQ